MRRKPSLTTSRVYRLLAARFPGTFYTVIRNRRAMGMARGGPGLSLRDALASLARDVRGGL